MRSRLMRCLAVLAVALAEAAFAGSITVVKAMTKVRRGDTGLPATTQVSLEAAKNEFEAFQIVLAGPANNVVVKASALVGPGGAQILPATCGNAGDIRWRSLSQGPRQWATTEDKSTSPGTAERRANRGSLQWT